MTALTRVVWREWFNAPAVARMTEMRTLPREEVELNLALIRDGADLAEAIAEDATQDGSELFRSETEIVILEPAEFAGTYRVCVDYEPTYTAFAADLD
jgi:hypothetical protein